VELPGPLIDPAWLAAHLGDPGLAVADVRWTHGASPARIREDFEAGHLPGAVLVDLDRDLAGVPGGPLGRHPLPDPEVFAAAMRRAGIGSDTAVVVVDDAQGSIASRLWWMLGVQGHRNVGVLDGGTAAWTGPRETGPGPAPSTSDLSARPWPRAAVVGIDDLEEILRRGTTAVLDARAPERYRGEVEPIDPVAGHIPGARSAPWQANLDPETGRFLPADRLARRYADLGAGPGTVAYCGSGVTATHDLLAMRVAGIEGARLLEASWSGWVHDASRPIATGDETGRLG
jgi:thiosulfate/3-mercaptopyruvate sulfurtransferase